MLPEEFDVISESGRITYLLRRDRSTESAPVYEAAGTGAEGRPTGSVWVRFAEGIDAMSRAPEIERAGYHIERVPGYAQHAAFVRGADIGAALRSLDALRAIPGVERVEPELITERSLRR